MTTIEDRTAASGVRFSAAEVHGLLTLRPGPGADLSRSVLRLSEHPVRAGLSALAARSLLVMEGDGRPRPLGPASVLGCALTGARRWTSIALTTPEEGRTLLVVECPEACLLLVPHAPELLTVLPLQAGTTGPALIEPTVTVFLDAGPRRAIGIATTTRRRATAFAAGTEDGTGFWVSHGPEEYAGLDRAGVGHLVRLAVDHAERSGT